MAGREDAVTAVMALGKGRAPARGGIARAGRSAVVLLTLASLLTGCAGVDLDRSTVPLTQSKLSALTPPT